MPRSIEPSVRLTHQETAAFGALVEAYEWSQRYGMTWSVGVMDGVPSDMLTAIVANTSDPDFGSPDHGRGQATPRSIGAVMRRGTFLLCSLFLVSAPLEAQIQASPKSSISTVIDGTTVEVEYHRPSVRGRALFGELVPWGVRWTPGANWATVLRVDRDVRMNGVEVPAGEYSLWMTPRPDRFTLSLDPEPRIFHALKPDSTDTQIHIAAEPEPTAHTEMLTWRIPQQRGDGAVLEFAWGETAIPFDIVVHPSRAVSMEDWEREMYSGTYALTMVDAAVEGFGLPKTAELRVFEEDGKLRAELPFPLHPNDELVWDLVPAGGGRFNPGLYRGDTLFTIEMGVNVDFEVVRAEDRVVGVELSMPNGFVWAEGAPDGSPPNE